MSKQAEMRVIGSIILDDTALAKCTNLSAEMFMDETLRYLFQKSLKLLSNGERVNIQTLSTVCVGKLGKTDLEKIIKTCLEQTETSAFIEDYARDVIKDFQSFRLNNFIKIKSKTIITSANVDAEINEFNNLIDGLQFEDHKDSATAEDLVKEFESERFIQNRREFLFIGFPNLDEDIGGVEGGDVMAIAARPAVGKSAFINQIIVNLCKKGKSVEYYNLEMTKGQVYDRFICHLSGIPLKRIRHGTFFKDGEEERFRKANRVFSKFKLNIVSGKTKLSDIEYSCRHNKPDVVVIDYLQLIKADTVYKSRREEVGVISKAIKNIAMTQNIPVIVISQLNRTNNETKEPNMSDLRESGDIEQDVSVLVMIWNKDERRTEKGVKVEKCRNGEPGKEFMTFDGSTMTFKEVNTKRNQTVKAEFQDLDDDNPFGD